MEGCFYNPRPAPGRCIKDTRSNVVESQCELVDHRCVLKQNKQQTDNKNDKRPSVIYVPTPPTLDKIKRTKTEQTDELNSTKQKNELNSTLSGPVTAYSGSYSDEDGNKKLIFLGDFHFSSKNICQPPCKSLGPNMELTDNDNNCYTTNRLLMDIFNKAQNNREYVDFYLEIPFLPKLGYKPTRSDIDKTTKMAGEIYNIFYTFYDYFTKNKSMNYVRFHYVDVRLQYKEAEYNQMMSDMEALMGFERAPFEIKQTTYEDNIVERINKSINLLGNAMVKDNRSKNKYIETTDKLIKELYFSGGQTMRGYEEPLNIKLFRLYLESDDFINDSNNLVPNQTFENVVTRGNKTMHRVRAQLSDLESKGYTEVSNKIKEFVMSEYTKNVNNNLLMDLWRKFMKIYDNYINARSRMLGDNITAINDLKKEYEKITYIGYLNVSSTALLMDAYLLARMFRFNIPETNQTKIIYAGAAHIDNYYRFFRDYFNVYFDKYGNVSMDINEKSRCIKVDINKFL